MNEITKEINEAFKLLSSILVAGDAVDVMAAARGHLRRAYKLAGPEQEEAESNG